VFIGLENINPDSLKGASKGQNHITEYRRMLQAWRKAKVLTYAGYILGFPADTAESIERDIGIIQRELPIDIMEFFMLTPGPGSKDHQDLYLQGVELDPDTNKYDSEHAVTSHPRMRAQEWEAIFKRAWHLYYTPQHIETLLKRAVASGIRTSRIASMILYFYASPAFEGVHPLQSGIFRRKCRTQRRPGFPKENPVVFYPRRAKEIIETYVPGLWFFYKLERLRRRIERDPASRSYSDIAIAPVAEDYSEGLELYSITETSRRETERARNRAENRAAQAVSV
jgi:hypothetical protein